MKTRLALPLSFSGLLLCLCPALSTATTDEANDSRSFVLHEYWTCKSNKLDALKKASAEIWSPIFDALVAEGILIGWGHRMPKQTLAYESADSAGTEEAPDHNWFAWFESSSASANEAAWSEFGVRLKRQHANNPRPWFYCDALKVTTYEN